jgi:hypothetical protein
MFRVFVVGNRQVDDHRSAERPLGDRVGNLARLGQSVHYGSADPNVCRRFPHGQEVGLGVQSGPPFEADRRAINASTAVSKRLPLPFTDAIHK